MKLKSYLTILSFFLLTAMSTLYAQEKTKDLPKQESIGVDNVAYKWGKMALTAQANDTEKIKPRPTITSRFLALIFVSVFDAWSRYDEKAIPVYLKDVERKPAADCTLSNKEIAISFAAYRSMCEYYSADKQLFASFMIELGLNPNDNSFDPNTPQGVGNLAAKAVIEARRGDGANQYAEEGGSNGMAYFDYVNYKPVNTVDKNTDPNRWQPKYFSDGKGGKFAPGCLTPFWNKVTPISIKSADQFRPGPPPLVGSKEMEKEVKELVDMQKNLTDYQKALVEFMRDGPKSVQQAGHWLNFAQKVSIRDQHNLDQDVKMYFYNQIVAMDAFIACWDAKMYYDSARPYALVHEYYKGKQIKGWAGVEKGFIMIDGNDWQPYSPATFLCPPFPSYTSGHSTVSGACGEALKIWTGSDRFGAESTLTAGAMTDPDHLGGSITLKFPTFTEAADMAGLSRVLGGYHIQSDNIEGLNMGRKVAREAWKFYNIHIGQEAKKLTEKTETDAKDKKI